MNIEETTEQRTAPLTAGATTEAFAAVIGYHPETVRRLVREGRIHALKFGRTWRIPPDESQRILANGLPA